MNRADRLYGALLRVLPAPFRDAYGREMALIFRARRQRDASTGLWAWALGDLAQAAIRERIATMKTSDARRQVIGATLLLIPVVFIVSQVLVYELNVPGLSNPFDVFYNRPGLAALGYIMDALIFLGPLVAFGLMAPLFLRQSVRWRPADDVMVAISLTRSGLVTATLMLVGLGLGALFTAYLLAENWACLLGAATSC